jgi:hypothetical protein
MRKSLFVTTPVLSVLFTFVVFAQDGPPLPPQPVRVESGQGAGSGASPCPRIEVQSPAVRGVREGQPVMFIANIAGGDPKATPQIIWSVNGGTIKEGQQTRRIEVDTAGAGAYREITADIWVGGYSGECQSQASATVRIVPPASKADEFGELAAEKENERLANLATALSQSEDHLYVIVYAGRTSVRGYAVTALRRIRTQLSTSGLDAARIMVIDGGFREQPAYELWVVPQGAEAPKPSPTVDRREIVYRKATPATPAKKPGRP